MQGTPRIILGLQRLFDDNYDPMALLLVERERSQSVQLPGSGPLSLLVKQEAADLVLKKKE